MVSPVSSQPESERRGAPRVAVEIDIVVARKVGNPVTVCTCDLSSGGACVVSPRPLAIYEELRFDLDLPAGGAHLDGTLRVLRQATHDSYAVRFEHLTPAAAQALADYVAGRTG